MKLVRVTSLSPEDGHLGEYYSGVWQNDRPVFVPAWAALELTDMAAQRARRRLLAMGYRVQLVRCPTTER